jgi:cytochrome c553
MKKILPYLLIAAVAALCSVASAADVETNWNKNCKACHGPDGKGETMMGKKAGCRDYTDPKIQASLKEEDAIKAVKEGLKKDGKTVMKPFSEKLTDDEIKALIAHMRKFKK